MKNKKLVTALMSILIVFSLIGCNAKTQEQNTNPFVSSETSKNKIVTTNVKERGLCFSIAQK